MTTDNEPLKAQSVRYRVNVSTTSKGMPSWDVTVDGQDSGESGVEILARIEAMVRMLQTKYPTEVPL